MQEGIHPEYYPVVFIDVSTGDEIVTKSTKKSGETKEIDGRAPHPEVRHHIPHSPILHWSATTGGYGGSRRALQAEVREEINRSGRFFALPPPTPISILANLPSRQ